MGSADLSDIWNHARPRERPTVYLRWLWDPVPGTRRRPDAEVPGTWSPLLALQGRLWVTRQLIREKIRALAGRPVEQSQQGGRPDGRTSEGE